MEPDPERVAHEALTAFVRRSLVLIVFARQGERTPHHGSGTLIVGPSDRVGVLTAAHVVRPGDFISLVTTDEFHQDVVDEVVHAPDNVDVAIAFVRRSVAPAFRDSALALESIEFSTKRKIPQGSLLVAAGFPEQFTYDERHPTHGWLQHRFVDVLNPTSDFKHDHRFISIRWKQGTVTGETFPFEDLGVPRETPIQFKKPSGLSGGPVYRVRTTQKGVLWSPTSDATLVGIAIEFVSRRELALPWWRWSQWVRNVMSK